MESLLQILFKIKMHYHDLPFNNMEVTQGRRRHYLIQKLACISNRYDHSSQALSTAYYYRPKPAQSYSIVLIVETVLRS